MNPSQLFERDLSIETSAFEDTSFDTLKSKITGLLEINQQPVRFTVSESRRDLSGVEIGVLQSRRQLAGLFDYRQRRYENTDAFNVICIIPTGIGCHIGGHAGDANPVARLLASACDRLILHPNVVNASDINEMTDNCIYVEGSSITRLLMGTIGLRPTRRNRILAIIDETEHQSLEDLTINAINAARATLGVTIANIAKVKGLSMTTELTPSGRAVGVIKGIDHLFDLLDQFKGTYDAVSISSSIDVTEESAESYVFNADSVVNPWGGVEAMLTHAISYMYHVPSAHAPILTNPEYAIPDYGIVDARISAEMVSQAFVHCVLKGLHQSPQIKSGPDYLDQSSILAEDISALVIPDSCVGLPTLAALAQGIPVIAVRENKNLMRNDLQRLNWADGQLHVVDNYWEAAGVLLALKQGINPASARRPFHTFTHNSIQ